MGAATEIVVEELTKVLLKQGAAVEIIDIASDHRAETTLPIREVKVPKCFAGTDVQLGVMHKLKRVVYSISLAFELKKVLEKATEKVVLHFHNQYNLFFFYKLIPAALRQRAVIAYTNHSYIWHSPWDEIKDTVRKRYFQEVYCMEHADWIFVLNEQTRKTLITHLSVPADRICLIGNGVNTDVYFKMDEEECEHNKEAWGVRGKKVFVQVGSVCDRKNQLGALQSLLPLMQKEEDIVFCYAGGIIDSEYQEAIRKLAADHGLSERVVYAGELTPGKKLNEFYNLAEAMIFPSKAEGFSLVILEAMSAGTPVMIGKNLKFSMAEDCISYHDAEFAQVAETEILTAEQQRLRSAKARQVVMEAYSWDSIAQDYMAVWQKSMV